MESEPYARFPDEIVVDREEVRRAMKGLEDALEASTERGIYDVASTIDAVLGQMTRWLWDLLRELDEEE